LKEVQIEKVFPNSKTKDHLTEHRLTECHLTESTFDRNAVLPKVHYTEKSLLAENKIYQKVV
jgi:hypothetical protein